MLYHIVMLSSCMCVCVCAGERKTTKSIWQNDEEPLLDGSTQKKCSFLFIHLFSQSFIHSFVHSFTHSFIYACMVQKQLAPFAVYEYVCCSWVCVCAWASASAWECLRVTTFSFFGSILIFFNPFFFCVRMYAECTLFRYYNCMSRDFSLLSFFHFVFTVSCFAGSDWCCETYSAAAAADADASATLSFLFQHILLGSIMNCI